MRYERTAQGVSVWVDSEAGTEALGRALAAWVAPGTVIGLIGPLGAGKTRLSRAVAEALGVEPAAISSPTYVLIHEYQGRLPVYHFDTYRLGGPDEFEALGAADYFDADGVCLIEWADRVLDLLPRDRWLIRIEPEGAARRFHLELTSPERFVDCLARSGGRPDRT